MSRDANTPAGVRERVKTNRVRAALCQIGLMLAAVSASAQAPAPLPPWLPTPWKAVAPIPEAAEELYAVTIGQKMYVFGGISRGVIPKGDVMVYDAQTDTWTKKRPMAVPAHHTAVAALNGKIYLFGGFATETGVVGWKPIADAMEYDPEPDTWRALPPLSIARGSAVAEVVGGKIYVIGGAGMNAGEAPRAIHPFEPQRSVDLVEEFDPATNTWRQRASMPTPRNHMFSGTVDGKIYVMGGRVGTPFIMSATNTDVVEVYDPAKNAWGAPRAQMPTPRSGGASGVYGGKIYAAGGEFQDGRMMAAFRTVEAFDPATNSWSTLPRMIVPRHGHAGGFLGSNFHIVSGNVQSAAPGGPPTQTPRHDKLDVSAVPK
jgi:N-acetylneuraminic acid mutarotase